MGCVFFDAWWEDTFCGEKGEGVAARQKGRVLTIFHSSTLPSPSPSPSISVKPVCGGVRGL